MEKRVLMVYMKTEIYVYVEMEFTVFISNTMMHFYAHEHAHAFLCLLQGNKCKVNKRNQQQAETKLNFTL